MAKAKIPEVTVPSPPGPGGTTGLVQDEVIARLVPDPVAPPDVIALVGFLGKSPRPRFWRLYQTLDLKDYLEIAEGDIVHSESLETKLQPLGGTVIWVKSGARLQHIRSESRLAETVPMPNAAANLNLSKSNVSRVAITVEGVKGDDGDGCRAARGFHTYRAQNTLGEVSSS